MSTMFPAELAGRSIDCVFDAFTPRLTFGAKGLRVELKLPDFEMDDVVNADVRAIRPNVFAVNWTEPNGNFVVQVQDHANNVVHNYARLADGQQFCATGTIRPVAG
jgi:hypothetical protein